MTDHECNAQCALLGYHVRPVPKPTGDGHFGVGFTRIEMCQRCSGSLGSVWHEKPEDCPTFGQGFVVPLKK